MRTWTWLRWLLLCEHLAHGAGDPVEPWADLEDLARRKGTEVSTHAYWEQRVFALHKLHPHQEASAVLSWLYLFGLPSETPGQPLVARQIDKAIEIAREGAGEATCARCFALLGFILALGYPPLVGAAHLTLASPATTPRLVFLGTPATPATARLPRDVGPPDPSAAAYVMAAQLGDAVGILASSYLSQKGLMNETLKAPMANQASSMISRKPQLFNTTSSSQHLNAGRTGVPEDEEKWRNGLCTSLASESLGPLATQVVDTLSDGGAMAWGDLPEPMAMSSSKRQKDRAFVEHVLADVSNAEASDVAHAATLLEKNLVDVNDLPGVSRRHADVSQLYLRAAHKGDASAALRTAVEHLQRNESEKATPLLEQVTSQTSSDSTSSSAMAQYYLTRFGNESTEATRRDLAWPHLLRAAELGRPDAELLVAHAHLSPGAQQTAPNSTEAARRYRRLVQPSASADSTASHKDVRKGNLSEIQAFAAYNLGVLSLNSSNNSEESTCSIEAQELFQQVALSQGYVVRLILALERRAAKLGDFHGALLLAMLLSDMGHELGHLDAAYFWDRWSTTRSSQPMGDGEETEAEEARPCDLHGWWTTNSSELLLQNVTKLFAAKVSGGGFEMFNASGDSDGADMGLVMKDAATLPRPETSEFQHLHSFLWHTTYDAFPGAGPIPVALQPPNAVPHLVEFHHQRGKLTVDKTCSIVFVDGMLINWTFHRDGFNGHISSEEIKEPLTDLLVDAVDHTVNAEDWLHCWVRPERYYVALKASLEASQAAPPGTWEEVMSLTTSNDCPCYGGFACRRGDGACEVLAKQSAGSGEESSACKLGSTFCREVPLELDPPRSNFAASPEVCGFYYYRRAAMDGDIDAMHVLSHAFSNGHRGAPQDPVEAFKWSERAMKMGDLRGWFDVAYSTEFGLGTSMDPDKAMQMYKEILTAQGLERDSLLGRAAANVLSLLASGRYVASRLLSRDPDGAK